MTRLELDFTVTRGDFDLAVDADVELAGTTAVFGASGAGKTTLLRVVAGLDRPARGRVACSDAVWDDATVHVPAHRRRVGYVFQDGRLFVHLSVAGNLRFAERHARAPGPITMPDAVAALDLEDLLERGPLSLSGGEQQRIALARALLTNPRLLVMDEPLSSLDAARRREIAAYIERVPERFGVPILYVTHDIDEVIRLADRMLLLSRGRVAAHGTVKEILGRRDLWPLTGRLEAGSILEAGVVAHSAGMTALSLEGQTLRMPQIAAPEGTTIMLRVHARDVAIATQRPSNLSIRNVLTARLSSIDLDETVYAELLLEIGAQTLRARITREALEELKLASGQTVYALIKSVILDEPLSQ
jgi:molybdate transport system ATP-binding protein